MSFLKRLFGGGDAKPAASGTSKGDPAATMEHNGFTIHATPYQDQGQWQLCGVIEKEIGGELKSHRFVRADRFPGKDDAVQGVFQKAKLIIDQQGEKLFG